MAHTCENRSFHKSDRMAQQAAEDTASWAAPFPNPDQFEGVSHALTNLFSVTRDLVAVHFYCFGMDEEQFSRGVWATQLQAVLHAWGARVRWGERTGTPITVQIAIVLTGENAATVRSDALNTALLSINGLTNLSFGGSYDVVPRPRHWNPLVRDQRLAAADGSFTPGSPPHT